MSAIGLKVCGVTVADDLRACRDLGVDAVGLNLWAESKRHVTLDEARRMVEAVPDAPPLVAVVIDPDPTELVAIATALPWAAVQFHGPHTVADHPGFAGAWIRVLRGVVELDTLPQIDRPPRWTLLDAATPGFGGHGVAHDLAFAALAVARLPGPVWLAGGLRPETAAAAIARVRPAGIDVASGTDREGDARRKDPAAIAALIRICHNPNAA